MPIHRIALTFIFALIAVACSPAPTAEPTAEPTRAPITAQATATPAPTRPPKGAIKIAVAAPLSGEQQALGENIKLGATLAIKQLSKPLIDLGYGVEIAPFDDRANPNDGVANARMLVDDREIFAVIGPLNSTVAISMTETLVNADLVLISPGATSPKFNPRGFATIHRVIGRDDLQGAAAATFAIKELGARSVFVINDKSPYGMIVTESFRDTAKRLGATIAGEESTTEKTNFETTLNAIKNANPDAVYFGGFFPQAGAFLKQLRAKNIKAQFIGPDGIGDAEFPHFAGDAAVGAYFTSLVVPPALMSDAGQFTKDLKTEFGKDAGLFSAQAYDATAIALQAITRAAQENNLTRKNIAPAIRATKDYKGITGVFAFNTAGDWIAARYFVIKIASANTDQWNKNTIAKVIEIAPNQ